MNASLPFVLLRLYSACLLLSLIGVGGATLSAQTRHVVTTQGFFFVPEVLQAVVGDTVVFDIDPVHNVIEVNQVTWQNLGNTANGGFVLPAGGGEIVLDQVGTRYYVCGPHAMLGMRGQIQVQSTQATSFRAHLSGQQEMPPVLSAARGMVTATLDGNELTVTGSFSQLSSPVDVSIAGGAHLHAGYAGRNGGVELLLTSMLDADSLGGTFPAAANTFVLTPDQLALLQSRQLYLNLHTRNFPGGELRGQLLPEADAYYLAYLSGSQEVDPVFSRGTGLAIFEQHGDSLVASGSFAGLQSPFNAAIAGGAHLHLGAAGMNGAPDIFLQPELDADMMGGTFAADSNTFVLDPTQWDALMARGYYVNLHSLDLPSGELRGQVGGLAQAFFYVPLSGQHEPTPAHSLASGMLFGELMADSTLVVTGSFAGLSSDYDVNVAGGAHLHRGLAGTNGPVAYLLDASLDPDMRGGRYLPGTNTFMLDAAGFDDLMARRLYANIHTTAFGGGELRGQLQPAANAYFYALLSGSQEARPVNSPGGGGLAAELRGDMLTVSGSFMGLSSMVDVNIAGGAHLHRAAFGANGPITHILNLDLDSDGLGGRFPAQTYPISSGKIDSLAMRQLYLNLHTLDFGGGELRGQLLPPAAMVFFAALSGSSEMPPLDRMSSGGLVAELQGDMLRVSGSFQDLESDFDPNVAGGSHLHAGFAGQNGPVKLFLAPAGGPRLGTFLADDNSFMLSAGLRDTLMERGLYANLHTVDDQAGELRGNLLPAAGSYFTTFLSGDNEPDPVMGMGKGALKLELSGDQLTVTGAFAGLESDYDEAVGVHLHLGAPGTNGGVEVFLQPVLDSDLRGGYFPADSNRFTLSMAQLADLRSGMLYANLHTLMAPGGEIRGQILPEPNAFPADAPMIMSPASGALVTVSGDGSQPFGATWSAATDPDGNALVYRWQLATAPDFDLLLVDANVLGDTEFMTDLATVDSLLASAGLNIGDTVQVYHRALASDGALHTPGMADSVTLVRAGLSTRIDDRWASTFSLRAAPVPVADWTRLTLEGQGDGPAQLRVTSLDGREVARRSLRLRPGSQVVNLNTQDWARGVYLIQVATARGALATLKVTKE